MRINGRATLLRDAPWFDAMIVKGHRPAFALLVEIEQIFYHCAKAFLRSRAVEARRPGHPDVLPSTGPDRQEVEPPTETLEELERHYGPAYAANLYG